MSTKHVIFDAIKQVMRCEHCGVVKPVSGALPIIKSVELIAEFSKTHKDCKP